MSVMTPPADGTIAPAVVDIRRSRREPSSASVKVVIAGGFGVGKTTFVSSVSEITPVTTEAKLTATGAGIDDVGPVPLKTSTTVAMDFGRRSFGPQLSLYLFGTPGQERFWFMWDDVVRGAIGAIVLVDTRRLDDCFAALDYFEEHGLPFVVALNPFDGQLRHSAGHVREALHIDPAVPIVTCDARSLTSTRDALVELVTHAVNLSDHAASQVRPA